ncbi:5-deoxy-glucuronate isomerase [Thermus scotoductus]|uniref:5-deoxy-glucuronate isomerase n=1 Tax=Thermus scotoductus TaxID=37636 RepID=A0A430QWB7_THESC|nr:5-deoxy-glucuronate isomerase [Thermus scotoductus]RTG99371.1 5-deoxy-glucuronate isomerase [Thermus scotoductus]RTH21304.1 5-deoxy-glucuronate isomerase [Thermus scotoductus]RTI33974.1 5-deoxy-glucuronate isomerase [Thermus scotoductus]
MIRLEGQVEILRRADPQSAGWRYLHFFLLRTRGTFSGVGEGLELALVPLEGEAWVETSMGEHHLRRSDVFRQVPQVLYLPPQSPFRVSGSLLLALGGAPAQGAYPERLWEPESMRRELRGGGAAFRQVNHILGPDLPAERLILYEVYTPSGHFSGWPPHRHDGVMGSPYMEETYLYRIQPREAFALHLNYEPERGWYEAFLARDLDLILVPRGYHPVAAPPGANVYYLNYMAGDLVGAARATPPVDDPVWAWVKGDWSGRPLRLPIEEEK